MAKEQQLRVVEIFPKFWDENQGKEAGLLLKHLHKHGADCTLVTIPKKTYTTPDPRIKQVYFKRPYCIPTTWYIFKNAKNIDVLYMFHSHPLNIPYTIAYRLGNPKGIAYSKADMDETILNLHKITPLNLIRRIKIWWNLYLLDVFSVEQERVCRYLQKRYPKFEKKIMLLPNGYGDEIELKEKTFAQKDNMIMNIGRIGSEQKATDTALEVMELIKPELIKGKWKMYFVGQIRDEFKPEIDKFYKKHPELKKHVIFYGPTKTRKETLELYNKSKILFMPSRWEGFSNVPSEAAKFNNAIVGTPVGGVNELAGYGKNGKLCKIGDSKALAKALKEYMTNQKLLQKDAEATHKLCLKEYYWPTLTRRLLDEFYRIRKSKSSKSKKKN